jgi:hypothetical protein
MDYESLFQHVSALPKLVIVTAPRAGSDFFQSLLDGHPQILQLPGQFQFYEFWSNALCREDLGDLIEEFVWHRAHISKFKSNYQKEERWNILGDSKSESFEVSIPRFKRHLQEIMRGRALTSRNFFLAVHLAYCLAVNTQDVMKARLLVCHLHEFYRLEPFIKDFSNFKVIYCTRDPRSTIVSTVENLMADHGQMNLHFFRYWLKWIFNEAEQVIPYTRQVKTLPLEKLHNHCTCVLEEFCRDFDLEYCPALLESTWHGKRWWGDARSKRFLKGFNTSINERRWEQKLTLVDTFLVEFLLRERMKAYGHDLSIAPRFWHTLAAPFLIPLPMKYEWRIALQHFRQSTPNWHKAYSVAVSLVSYAGRVGLYYKYYIRRLRGLLFIASDHYGNKTGPIPKTESNPAPRDSIPLATSFSSRMNANEHE